VDVFDGAGNRVLDIVGQINQVRREVGHRRLAGGEGRAVVLRRDYDVPVEDVWDACTDPERISRWLLPVTGDLRPGGRYQLEGNAGGEILVCAPPHQLTVTWVYADDPPSEVRLRLSSGAGGRTCFELEHTVAVDPKWNRYGPGAVGVGWDLMLVSLGVHLHGDDTAAWPGESPHAREFVIRSSQAWQAAHAVAGAPADVAAHAGRNTAAFYAPATSPDAGA
jgi:uncharacterized protein YndB with AHSA1/START domain